VEYTSNTGSNIPAPTTTPSTVGVEFAPQSTVGTASSTAPIPRFGPERIAGVDLLDFALLLQPAVPVSLRTLQASTTGVRSQIRQLIRTELRLQTGNRNLELLRNHLGWWRCAATATTTSSVAGGTELIFTLSNGGNFGIPATPGFEGYIIAQANFQYCHGFAFISDVGAQKLAEGYLAIQLDAPGLTRTHNTGENKGN